MLNGSDVRRYHSSYWPTDRDYDMRQKEWLSKSNFSSIISSLGLATSAGSAIPF